MFGEVADRVYLGKCRGMGCSLHDHHSRLVGEIWIGARNVHCKRAALLCYAVCIHPGVLSFINKHVYSRPWQSMAWGFGGWSGIQYQTLMHKRIRSLVFYFFRHRRYSHWRFLGFLGGKGERGERVLCCVHMDIRSGFWSIGCDY